MLSKCFGEFFSASENQKLFRFRNRERQSSDLSVGLVASWPLKLRERAWRACLRLALARGGLGWGGGGQEAPRGRDHEEVGPGERCMPFRIRALFGGELTLSMPFRIRAISIRELTPRMAIQNPGAFWRRVDTQHASQSPGTF